MAPHAKLSVVLAFVLTGVSTSVVALRLGYIDLCVTVEMLTFCRFYSRHFLVGRLSSSDWVMFLALVSILD